MSLRKGNIFEVLRAAREFMNEAHDVRNAVRDAKDKDSPYGEEISEEEREHIIQEFAEGSRALAKLLALGKEVGEEVASTIIVKFSGRGK